MTVAITALSGVAVPATAQADPAAGPTPGAPAPQARTTAPEGGASGQVTLVTGDRVIVSAAPGKPRAVRIERGPGREKTAFYTENRNGHLHVLPSDAATLVAQDLVDSRLFDVTQLIAWHYDDAHRADIPVIT
ncbi:hypothetical protein, partial [Nonomuraea lactucae]|uniref:hypothetical protein n=1 Tax=Nonomuraea lactucae TaxID=2249762 RepID=UPI00196519E6